MMECLKQKPTNSFISYANILSDKMRSRGETQYLQFITRRQANTTLPFCWRNSSFKCASIVNFVCAHVGPGWLAETRPHEQVDAPRTRSAQMNSKPEVVHARVPCGNYMGKYFILGGDIIAVAGQHSGGGIDSGIVKEFARLCVQFGVSENDRK